MKIPLLIVSFAIVMSHGAVSNAAAIHPSAMQYPSGLQQTISIGKDLYESLGGKLQQGLDPDTVLFENVSQPIIAPVAASVTHGFCQIEVSSGFIDLINHIAHAKAIDQIQPGYLKAYIRSLDQPGADLNPPPPPHLDKSQYWSDAVLDRQASLFNQMMGMTLALNLSQNYLAHCANHKVEMATGMAVPLNDYLGGAEWDQSVIDATVNSLDCAFATEGVETLVDVIAQLRVRPAWADYITPHATNVGRFKQQMTQYEYEYFHGDKALRRRVARGW